MTTYTTEDLLALSWSEWMSACALLDWTAFRLGLGIELRTDIRPGEEVFPRFLRLQEKCARAEAIAEANRMALHSMSELFDKEP